MIPRESFIWTSGANSGPRAVDSESTCGTGPADQRADLAVEQGLADGPRRIMHSRIRPLEATGGDFGIRGSMTSFTMVIVGDMLIQSVHWRYRNELVAGQ